MWKLLILTLFLWTDCVSAKKIKKNALVQTDKYETQISTLVPKSKKNRRRKEPILPSKREPLGSRAARTSRTSYKMAQRLIDASTDLTRAATNTVNRAIKSWLSSDFEKLLLQLTEANDFKPADKDIKEFLATITSFTPDRDLSPLNEGNSYRVFLRKTYAKMAEPDERTALKSVFLLHLVLRTVNQEDAQVYQKLFKKMRKERVSGGGRKSTYFDVEAVTDCTSDTQYLADFVECYVDYVFKRCHFFTCMFDELRDVDKYNMRSRDVATQLFHTIKVLESALACAPDTESGDAEEDCELVYTTALDLVARDAKVLFELFHEKLSWVLREAEIGDLFDSAEWKEEDVTALLAMFKRFYADTYPKLVAFLTDVEEVNALYTPREKKKKKKKKKKERGEGDTQSGGAWTLECPRAFPATFFEREHGHEHGHEHELEEEQPVEIEGEEPEHQR